MIQYTKNVNAATTLIKASEAALGPLSSSARLIKSDLIYGRFAPLDFKAFQTMCRRMSGRASALATFFSIVGVGPGAGPGMETDRRNGMIGTPAHTVPNSPGMGTPAGGLSRRASLNELDEQSATIPSTPHSTQSTRLHSKVPSSAATQKQSHTHSHSHSHHHHHHLLHNSLLALSRLSHSTTPYNKPNSGHETEPAVGTYESQRYLNLEATRLSDPNREKWMRKAMQLLGERWIHFFSLVLILSFLLSCILYQPSFLRLGGSSNLLFLLFATYGLSTLLYEPFADIFFIHSSCDPVLEVCKDGLTAVKSWLGCLRKGRVTYFLGIGRKERDQEIAARTEQIKELRDKISQVLESFRNDKRFVQLSFSSPSFVDVFFLLRYSLSFCSLQILDPYRPAFETPRFQSRKPQSQAQDPNSVTADMATKFEDHLNECFSTDDKHQIPPHRYLFYSYFYQYHLMQVCSIVIEMVRSSPLLPLLCLSIGYGKYLYVPLETARRNHQIGKRTYS